MKRFYVDVIQVRKALVFVEAGCQSDAVNQVIEDIALGRTSTDSLMVSDGEEVSVAVLPHDPIK